MRSTAKHVFQMHGADAAGRIHYTFRRMSIRHVDVNEAWIREALPISVSR